MTKKNQLIAAGAVAVVASLALAGTTFAHGADGVGRGENRLALTAEQKVAHQTEMKAKLSENLATAITDGKLTVDQQAHILEVMDQIHTKMEADDRSGANTLRDELRAWSTDQGIESVMPGRQGGGMGGHGRGGMGIHAGMAK